MQGRGRDQYRSIIERARQRGNESSTKHGNLMTARAIEPVAKAIRAFVAGAKTGRPQHRARASIYLELVDPEVAAMLSIRALLDHACASHRIQTVASDIGRRLEDEVRYGVFEGQAKPLFRKVLKQTDYVTSYQHKATVFSVAMNRAGITWEPWSQADKLKLGMKMVELIVEHTGYIRDQA